MLKYVSASFQKIIILENSCELFIVHIDSTEAVKDSKPSIGYYRLVARSLHLSALAQLQLVYVEWPQFTKGNFV